MGERDPGPIPNRWLYCPQKSDNLIADKFLAFKTPLSNRFDHKMNSDFYFHPDSIFQLMKSNKLKVGLWIDLTNTNRFYDRREIEDKNCQYVKLQCRGHGETPSRDQTNSFIEIVDSFINDHPIEVVAVHCTHGFNRTGFLIISYMIEKMDCSVEAALMAFSQARPPGIYKADYIKELYNRYAEDEDEEDMFPAPELPDWCYEYNDNGFSESSEHSRKRTYDEVDNDGEADETDEQCDNPEQEGESSGSSETQQPKTKKRKRRPERNNPNAQFMSGVPGVSLVSDQPRLSTLQTTVQDMCNWEGNGFPGCQPVSMDLKNIKNLHTKPYRVSWKADGTRYMMLILGENQIYFFDRDYACFQVSKLTFLHRKNLRKHLTNTLIDGEMVIDMVNGQSIPRFLVYDIIKFENEDIAKEKFYPTRLRCIEVELIGPRHEGMKRGLINRSKEPFSVRSKTFWDLTQARALLGPKFAKTLSHEPDGLIFQPSVDPYVPGRCDDVLKWKPSTLNSVDFKLKISEESGIGILSKKIGLLYVGGMDLPFGKMKYTKSIKDLNDKIIECKFENNSWVFMRERTDKGYPNSFNTAVAVCNSIKHPVTTEILLDFIDKHRFIDDSEAMPPPYHRNYP